MESTGTISRETLKKLREVFEKTPDSVITLAKHGWYVDFSMTPGETNHYAKKIHENQDKAADDFFVDHISKRLGQIQENLFCRFPKRKEIIEAAFSAHKKSEYNLSVPVLLIQAEGICVDITGIRLFSSREKKPLISKTFNKIDSKRVIGILLRSLTIQGCLMSGYESDPEESRLLNRHEVLHGRSIDYGTEVNSFKAISIIDFVGDVIFRAFSAEKNTQ